MGGPEWESGPPHHDHLGTLLPPPIPFLASQNPAPARRRVGSAGQITAAEPCAAVPGVRGREGWSWGGPHCPPIPFPPLHPTVWF